MEEREFKVLMEGHRLVTVKAKDAVEAFRKAEDECGYDDVSWTAVEIQEDFI
jgi:hypothetical protein